MDWTGVWISSGVPSAAVIISAFISRQAHNRNHAVGVATQHEVTTLNGKTIAVLAEEGETRRTGDNPQH